MKTLTSTQVLERVLLVNQLNFWKSEPYLIGISKPIQLEGGLRKNLALFLTIKRPEITLKSFGNDPCIGNKRKLNSVRKKKMNYIQSSLQDILVILTVFFLIQNRNRETLSRSTSTLSSFSRFGYK